MAFGDLVQVVETSTQGVGSVTVNFTQAVAGHLLIAGFCRSSAVTWNSDPSGWTPISDSGTAVGSMGSKWFWKISDGSETSIAFGHAGTSGSLRGEVAEFEGPFAASPFDVNAESEANISTSSTTQSTGTTGTTAQASELAVAIFAGDETTPVDGSRSYTNSFTEVPGSFPTTDTARCCVWLAKRVLSATGTVTTTMTVTDAGTPMYGAVATFKAAVDVTVSVSESITVAESVLALLDLTVSVFESITVAESVSAALEAAALSMQWTTNRQFVAPAAADGVSVTPSGTAWANSTAVELIASADADLVLTGVICGDHAVVAQFEVDVVIGASLNTVVCTLKGMGNSAVTSGHGYMQITTPVDLIPSGSRVGIRMRKSGTSTAVWRWGITYLKKPIIGNLELATTALVVAPSATTLVTLGTNTTPWDYGAWTEILSAAPDHIAIEGFCLGVTLIGVSFEIQLGRGTAGNEVPILTLAGWCSDDIVWTGYYNLPNPIVGVLSGERVSARWRKTGTSGTAASMGIVYRDINP